MQIYASSFIARSVFLRMQYNTVQVTVSSRWIDPQTTSNLDLHIQMINPDIDEKSKIWSFPNIGNRLSLFYKVSPIAIDSAVSREFSRVTEIDIHVRPKSEK